MLMIFNLFFFLILAADCCLVVIDVVRAFAFGFLSVNSFVRCVIPFFSLLCTVNIFVGIFLFLVSPLF